MATTKKSNFCTHWFEALAPPTLLMASVELNTEKVSMELALQTFVC